MAMITGKVQTYEGTNSKDLDIGTPFARKGDKEGQWVTLEGKELNIKKIETKDLKAKVEKTAPMSKDYYEPPEEQKRIEELETLLQEITKELLEFSSNGKIENIRSRIREVLGE